MPVERLPEFGAVIGLDPFDLEGELCEDVVDELDRGLLIVALERAQHTDTGAVIERGVLVVRSLTGREERIGVNLSPVRSPRPWDPGGQFEEGVGDVTAALYWRCEWLIAYADARGASDSEAAAEALTALRDWFDLSAVVENSDEETRSMWLSEIVSPAGEGDDTKLLTLAEECATS